MSIDDVYTNIKGAGDRMFWIEIAERGNVAIINKPINYCRRHNTNVTNNNWSKGIIQREEKQIMDYLTNRKLITNCQFQLLSASYIYNHILLQSLNSKELKKQLLQLWDYNLLKKIIVIFLKSKSLVFKLKNSIL